MVYRFIMLSDEVDNFKREYKLDSDATFLDLHNVIMKSVNYETGEMTSFYICNDDWSKDTEITLLEMNIRSEYDSIIMKNTRLSDYLEDEHQKLMLVFDYTNERAFFMELREIIFGESLDKAEIIKSVGVAPKQVLPVEEEIIVVTPVVVTPLSNDIEDDFYGDEGYNDDELDLEGFGDLDGDDDINEDISIDDSEL